MKKIIALIIAVLCLSSVTAFATAPVRTEAVDDKTSVSYQENAVITLDEDYAKIYLNNEPFVMAMLDLNNFSGFDELDCRVILTDKQSSEIASTKFYINSPETTIEAHLSFKNGGKFTAYYVKQTQAEDYQNIQTENWTKGEIDFYWPENNKVYFTKDRLFGIKSELNIGDTNGSYYVKAVSNDESVTSEKGMLYVVDDEYFYLDFNTVGVENEQDLYSQNYRVFTVFKITDEDLCDEIEDAIEENLADDYGFLDDDSFTNKIADFLLVTVFLVLPLAIAVLFFILDLTSKTKYKKLFRVIYLSALVEIIIFIILSFII